MISVRLIGLGLYSLLTGYSGWERHIVAVLGLESDVLTPGNAEDHSVIFNG